MQVKAAVYHVTAGNGVNRVLGQAGFIWVEVMKMTFFRAKTNQNNDPMVMFWLKMM